MKRSFIKWVFPPSELTSPPGLPLKGKLFARRSRPTLEKKYLSNFSLDGWKKSLFVEGDEVEDCKVTKTGIIMVSVWCH